MHPEGRSMTVEELVERYLSTRIGVKPNTKANYNFVKNLMKREDFYYKKIGDVKTSDAKLFLIKLQQDGKRYSNIDSFYAEISAIFMRDSYESAHERIEFFLSEYNKNRNINVTEIISLLNNDSDGSLIWELVSKFQDRCIDIFAEISDIAFPLALKEAQQLKDIMESGYHDWKEYDNVAYWARDVIYARNGRNDEININAAQILEYVADNVQRYKIRSLANSIKADDKIDGHIRAQISYFEGY